MPGITEFMKYCLTKIWSQLMLIYTSLAKHKQSDLQQTSYRGVLPECNIISEKDILYNYL